MRIRRAIVVIGLFKVAAVGAYATVLRQRQLHWGATGEEVAANLPGDEFIEAPDSTATRAITVHAGDADVWPWVAQLGQGRGGFYSYDALENLAGCEIRSADRIEPAWQEVSVGDDFRLHPQIALQVARVDPQRALVVAGMAAGHASGNVPYDFTWAFVLVPAADGTTRLVVRERYGYRTRWAALMVEPLSVVSWLMTQRMLRGVRDRVERVRSAVQ